jgi:hypothetical protein
VQERAAQLSRLPPHGCRRSSAALDAFDWVTPSRSRA